MATDRVTAPGIGASSAVLVYQIDSFRYLQEYFGRDDSEFGQFGENFTVERPSDDEVCIGDRYVSADPAR